MIAYFIGNISAKNIKICSCVSNLYQAIGGTFFETRCICVIHKICIALLINVIFMQ